MEKATKVLKIIAGIYAVLLAIFLIFSLCTVKTKPNEFTVVRQFGKVVKILDNSDYKSGLNFKIPFIQTTKKLPNELIMYDLPVSNVITSDKKTMVADSFTLWKITDPMKYVKQLNSSRGTAESRIDVSVYNALKNTISQTKQEDVISGRDGKLVQSINSNIGTSLDQYGIKLTSVETKHLDLPDSNKESVYTRMISERNQIAQQYKAEGENEAKKIRNEADSKAAITTSKANSDAEKIIAEGEAEYMKILSSAYGSKDKSDFYSYVRSLDAAKKSLTKGDVIYLNEDSPLASLFTKGF